MTMVDDIETVERHLRAAEAALPRVAPGVEFAVLEGVIADLRKKRGVALADAGAVLFHNGRSYATMAGRA